jgi:hypothetical protein
VAASNVRPRLPPPPPGHELELYDLVEAYHSNITDSSFHLHLHDSMNQQSQQNLKMYSATT